ncbi:hypothetical protein ACFRAI_34585 [Streptomyces sp. NPDC056637]|uniref:hypothetical protein n=1 Tax=unclassified Streptomyces TaxID=2593676 RepID=UPI0036412F67
MKSFVQPLGEGREIGPEDLAHISPYPTERIDRFGACSTHDLGVQYEAYGLTLDADFTRLRDRDSTACGSRRAAACIARGSG